MKPIYLSLGAGVQSSVLLLMSFMGKIPLFKGAIFADTQWESQETYSYLDWLEKKCLTKIPIYRTSAGNLKKDILDALITDTFPSIPFHLKYKSHYSMMKRQCTADYKVAPIYRKLRDLGENKVQLALGISFDEIQRMKPARVKWIENVWPLIDLRMSRENCLDFCKNNNFPIPPKSACLGCPFHNKQYWHDLKANSPKEWQETVAFDNKIRILPGMLAKAYIHQSLQPLEDAVKREKSQKNFAFEDFTEECEGHCGV